MMGPLVQILVALPGNETQISAYTRFEFGLQIRRKIWTFASSPTEKALSRATRASTELFYLQALDKWKMAPHIGQESSLEYCPFEAQGPALSARYSVSARLGLNIFSFPEMAQRGDPVHHLPGVQQQREERHLRGYQGIFSSELHHLDPERPQSASGLCPLPQGPRLLQQSWKDVRTPSLVARFESRISV